MRHENETVKYTVKEVMKENEDLKESMSNMQVKMNKIQVRFRRIERARISKDQYS